MFKPGTGTITIWENTGGTRGAVLYTKKEIPLTPGPLMVVIKVASSQAANKTGYWPPALPDSIETIAASYVESASMSKLRLFNLSPVREHSNRSAINYCGLSRELLYPHLLSSTALSHDSCSTDLPSAHATSFFWSRIAGHKACWYDLLCQRNKGDRKRCGFLSGF